MNKETYLWIAVFVAVAAGALYYRLFYQPTLLVHVGAPQNYSAQTIFAYQRLQIPVQVNNVGSSALKNVSLGFTLNGNTTTIYSITLPAGKQLTLYFNYSPSASGVYNFTAAIDPDRLYNIGNRQSTVYSTSFTVLPAENATPYAALPRFGSFYDSYDMAAQGALVSALLANNYSVSKVALTKSSALNAFLTPMVYVAGSYIKRISGAYGTYSNGAVYSIWIQGYLSPGIIRTLAQGKAIASANLTLNGENVTLVQLDNSTELCSWYEGGWLKLLGTSGSMNCTKMIPSSASQNLNSSIESAFIDKLPTYYGPVVANFSSVSGNYHSSGRMFLLNGSAMLEFIEENSTSQQNDVCLGIINDFNGTSYCSVYVLATGVPFGSTPPLSLISTKVYKGQLNASAVALINSSRILSQVGLNAALIKSFNLSGNSTEFLSGLRNACVLNVTIGCFNVTFENSTIGFDLINNYTGTGTVGIGSAGCYWHGSGVSKKLNLTLAPNATAHISVACYENGGPIVGVPLNLLLHLPINMTIQNRTQMVNGTAYII
ncbi:MAG: hypothetical protein KGH69_02345 [Candidatus Micrarchaeota archaeon]|nr:hypothetical protein [Candidatus Micrarchaeota archaeon]